MLALYGNGVGTGIAIGRARIISRPGQDVPRYPISTDLVDEEISRLEKAFLSAKTTLGKVKSQLSDDAAEEIGAFLGAHILMAEDPMLSQEPKTIIREQRINAEAALQQHGMKLAQLFNDIDDPYISSKSADIAQVIGRVLGELLNEQSELVSQPEGKFDDEIIVANDLTPGDTIELKKHKIGAFITNLGGPISHTAILARSMKIPAIVGLHGSICYLRTGDLLIIDGMRGVVIVNPDEQALESYAKRMEKILRRVQELDDLREAEAITLDGTEIQLMSNIELPEEIEESLSQKAMSVGLYRTEFLYMNRKQLPDEEEQFTIYSRILKRASCPVTIRTLDLGADKQVDGGRSNDAMKMNPALGLRAIRLCLHDLGLFKPQLRAIYRASAFGKLRMMIPMVSNTEELDQLYVLLDEVKRELDQQGHDYDHNLPIGGMIEVPAAAISADLFAHKLDFLSIGTNDLIQYTLAIDRIDDEVNYLYDPLHPSVLRLIKMTIDAGKSANIPVSMCGEMAGDVRYTRVLLALGLREFSMDPAALLAVKRQVRVTDVTKLESKMSQLLSARETGKTKQLISDINK
ncbi:MAG: phosphoenolpyruvate--protein phosphotransferase [Gammaproteobacteria bacterium]|nr:phosphoenolpyruvate--protein phosphotransferase [Gammaproteobacteria bacterium]